MRNKQAGGIVSFVIVGLALAALLGGGLYLSKHQGRVARDTDTSTPTVTQAPEPTKTEENKSDTQSGSAQQNIGQSQPSNQNTQSSNPTSSTTPPAQQRVANTGPSDTLPATGPGETAASVLMLGVLAFTAFRFIQSRRSFVSAALKR